MTVTLLDLPQDDPHIQKIIKKEYIGSIKVNSNTCINSNLVSNQIRVCISRNKIDSAESLKVLLDYVIKKERERDDVKDTRTCMCGCFGKLFRVRPI
jgi:hypothetical protein